MLIVELSRTSTPLWGVITATSTAVIDVCSRSLPREILHPSSVVAIIITSASGVAIGIHDLLLGPYDMALRIIPAASRCVRGAVAVLDIIAGRDGGGDEIGCDASGNAYGSGLAVLSAGKLRNGAETGTSAVLLSGACEISGLVGCSISKVWRGSSNAAVEFERLHGNIGREPALEADFDGRMVY
jgi:hypothetical protein